MCTTRPKPLHICTFLVPMNCTIIVDMRHTFHFDLDFISDQGQGHKNLVFFCMHYVNHNDWQLCHCQHVNLHAHNYIPKMLGGGDLDRSGQLVKICIMYFACMPLNCSSQDQFWSNRSDWECTLACNWYELLAVTLFIVRILHHLEKGSLIWALFLVLYGLHIGSRFRYMC